MIRLPERAIYFPPVDFREAFLNLRQKKVTLYNTWYFIVHLDYKTLFSFQMTGGDFARAVPER